jgi:GDP/UDP-N,N'-diacetylbacillosamine 2-epimerase (hydrolysing)
MIRIGVLTSSRADFGIYLPLLELMNVDKDIQLSIIVFGTHLSRYHGYTIDQIVNSGFEVKYQIESLLLTDTPESNATSTGLTFLKFTSFWGQHSNEFDIAFCLGDRFEMFAAVYAGVPFGIKFAHIHGGETTLGATDNIYRHAISHASTYHFTATDHFEKKVSELIGSNQFIYNVGSLSLDNLLRIKFLTIDEFYKKWEIDLSKKTILVTFHPETVAYKEFDFQSNVFLDSIIKMAEEYQILLTLPNTDTMGSYLRQKIETKLKGRNNIFIYENLGTESYFTAMKYCSLIFGNSSSGIIEAASFNKYVINIGTRQKGRLTSDNIITVDFDFIEIDQAFNDIKRKNFYYAGQNIYFKDKVAEQVLLYIKDIFSE